MPLARQLGYSDRLGVLAFLDLSFPDAFGDFKLELDQEVHAAVAICGAI
jgi:hypothetical protein